MNERLSFILVSKLALLLRVLHANCECVGLL